MIFALLAVATGLQAIVTPIVFSNSFGLPITDSKTGSSQSHRSVLTTHALAYVSLQGVRQLATGIVLLIYAAQGKWMEVATFLAVIGVLVAGMDGVFLARNGQLARGVFHALPGALIAALAAAVVYYNP